MSARDNILARIRGHSGRVGLTTEAEMAAVQDHIARHLPGPLPTLATHQPVKHFIVECARLTTTVAEVAAMEAIPAEVARYLGDNALQPHAVGWQQFAHLDWTAANIHFDNRPANSDDMVGITGCFCAIGETGTLLLLGAPATPKTAPRR